MRLTEKRYKWNFLETPGVNCCTFGCIENHWTIEKRRKVSWEKLKNSKHPCFAYLSGRVAYQILHWVYFCSLPFFKKTFDIWPCWRKIQTEKWTQEDLAAIDVGSLWHPILLAWTYFCSQKRPCAALAHGHGRTNKKFNSKQFSEKNTGVLRLDK